MGNCYSIISYELTIIKDNRYSLYNSRNSRFYDNMDCIYLLHKQLYKDLK